MPVLAMLSMLSVLAPFLSYMAAEDWPTPSGFRSETSMVLVPVLVTDHTGKIVTGLRREHFTVLDEYVAQPIVSFTGEDSPCGIALVLDISGSMRHTLPALQDVLHGFISESNPEDEFQLLTVSSQPRVVLDFTGDFNRVERSMRSAQAQGDTALIDTIYLALAHARRARHSRRAILILSDGMDNYSRYSKHELMNVAIESDLQIYTLALLDASSASRKPIEAAEERRGFELLQDLSERTGGLHFRAATVEAAAHAARSAALAIRNQYVIGYRAPDPRPSGKWHHINVKASVPHASVSARTGYYSR